MASASTRLSTCCRFLPRYPGRLSAALDPKGRQMCRGNGTPFVKLFFVCWLIASASALGCFRATPDNPVHSDPNSLFHGPLHPSLIVPNGTEQWYSGSVQLIQWSQGIVPPDSLVSLRLSLDDGQTFPIEMASNIANSGAFVWEATSVSSRACRIKITSSNTSQVGARFEILVKPVAVQQSTEGGEWPSWRNDRLVFMSNRAGQYDIYASNGPGQTAIRLTNNPADDRFPALDNKGYHLAYSSVRTGREEIWATSYLYDFRTDELQLSFEGGSKPAWRPLPGADQLAFLLPINDLLNIGTVQFSLPITRGSLVAPLKVLADNTLKDRLSWVFGPGGNQETLYYQEGGFNGVANALRKLPIASGFSEAQSISLPFSQPARHPVISLSGTTVAISVDGDIYLLRLFNGRIFGAPLQVTFGPEDDDYPDLKSDREVAFQSNRTGRWEIYTLTLP